MTIHYGATYNLEALIKTHLFIICATNSGTTFLRNALTNSENTWNLMREGHQMYGFSGPKARKLKAYRCWAANRYFIDQLTDADNYNWEKTKRAWYFQAYAKNENAGVFTEKSPPFLLVVDQLAANFKNARFLFMTRNPYAVVEGIRRQSSSEWRKTIPEDELLNVISTHVITALRFQRENIEKWKDRGVFFTYEKMCEEPEKVENLIKTLVPAIDDLDLTQRIRVREYDEKLRNMNDQQIARLSGADLKQINQVFSRYKEVFDYFDYPVIS